MKKLSVTGAAGIIFAAIILIFFVLPGVVVIGMRMIFEICSLIFYGIIAWAMFKIIEHCLKDKEEK